MSAAARPDVRIGVDVGGTNTDVVVMSGRAVLAAHKSRTTPDITSGIEASVRALSAEFRRDDVSAVMIGTTHFTNAFVERSGLARVAVLRLGLPAATSIPPFSDWPDELARAVRGLVLPCHGGYEFDGRPISPVDPAEIRAAAGRIAAAGITSVAISSIFSPICADAEREAAAIIGQVLPAAHISLSHEIGRIGLLERENATIINAALRPAAGRITAAFLGALDRLGIPAPLFISQNDGTLLTVDEVRRSPVLTFASGPTNSMRGAAFLSGRQDCLVVDVGGTTTDIGPVVSGYPRSAPGFVKLAGIRTNFRMPDVASVGIGGGSLVLDDDGTVRIGPRSVGHRLPSEGIVFGGAVVTASDVAVAAGLTSMGDPGLAEGLPRSLVAAAVRRISADVAGLADQMRMSADPVCWVLTGGGSVILPDAVAGGDCVLRPAHFDVANAVGAAIAQIGAELDRVVAIGPGRREAVLDDLREEAVNRAIASGAAAGSVEIVEVDEIPLSYLPGNATRVRVRAVGDLAALGQGRLIDA